MSKLMMCSMSVFFFLTLPAALAQEHKCAGGTLVNDPGDPAELALGRRHRELRKMIRDRGMVIPITGCIQSPLPWEYI